MAEPIAWDPSPGASLLQALGEAVGAASTCWESLSGTGVFQDQRATAIVDGLARFLQDLQAEQDPNGTREAWKAAAEYWRAQAASAVSEASVLRQRLAGRWPKGEGQQESWPMEVGVEGVTVRLWRDANGGLLVTANRADEPRRAPYMAVHPLASNTVRLTFG